MKLLRCALRNKEQEIVLQGMVHFSNQKTYRRVQKDIDHKAREGFQIFYEGVANDELPPGASEQEQQIAKYFDLMFSLVPELINVCKVSHQSKEIKYPDNAINADIRFSEMVRKLAEDGFANSLFMRRLTVHLKRDDGFEKGLKSFFNTVARVIPLVALLNLIRKVDSLFGKTVPRKKEDAILLDYRNEVIIGIVTEDPGNKKVAYYGETHLPGMIQLLQERGWKLVSSTKMEI